MEMWLQIKTPEVADGNNFGVEVQAFVAGELKVPAGPLDGPKGVGDGPHCQHLLCCPRLRPVHMNTCALVRRVSPPPHHSHAPLWEGQGDGEPLGGSG